MKHLLGVCEGTATGVSLRLAIVAIRTGPISRPCQSRKLR